ncbi:electron transfer flavoprotein subunit alpha/FixB family protein [Garciella nitratireducens]|uniref:Electron transfer flavoprotein alpha subunit apoprotein n=1 Tax=Garciella nitratireducens DSM 15102 TaxID=1121911 RepID=A0A1T4P4W0_9FIRM|nr:electron transfer flavoprotein subunit alpha/FixB family protein [Garciella nitratireducens]RBP46975.1 electron transfer flavoprotein alpha subunit apoprotein [Garciella nitratireducens]SJZ86296.1 electron transfer flavoprotein alpha subunit apoprotein [Garciella nitratireducens DSM 15102]
MAKIEIIQNQKIEPHEAQEILKICPFGAIEWKDGKLDINSGCKMCKLCTKQKPQYFQFVEDEVKKEIDKSLWKGVVVYVEHTYGDIHPVTFELLGKARELADKIGHEVIALFAGYQIQEKAEELLHYGADKVFVYDEEALKDFRIEPYTAVFEDFINKQKPSVVLVGGTTIGRSLAPRVAARFKTGLTADCTSLEIEENTDLSQIRPAFGGNIMAHIKTPNSRPQFATVRYKIFSSLERAEEAKGEIIPCQIDRERLKSNIKVLDIKEKEKAKYIEDAEVLVVAGRGVQKEEDLAMIEELANLLGGMVASTRPLIEAGWTDPKVQIGLSGRTVKPKLIITCGVSGSVQFRAGMQNSETIIAINTDPNAPIFDVANYSVIGDIYEIVPKLIDQLRQKKIEEVPAI